MVMLPVRFDVWIAALSAGYMPLERFVTWADQRVLAHAYQPRWVLDLSLSTDVQKAKQVLWEEWSRQAQTAPDQVPELTEPGILHVGFLYLAFRDGRLSMAEMLERAGMYADGPGYFCINVSCESFFCPLNESNGGGPTTKSDRPLAERVDQLFAPFVLAATAVLGELPPEPAAT